MGCIRVTPRPSYYRELAQAIQIPPEEPVLDLRGGSLFCRACAQGNAMLPVALPPASLEALRFILEAPANKAFSFSLGEEAERRLSGAAERYVQEQLERRFSTLDYYKRIRI